MERSDFEAWLSAVESTDCSAASSRVSEALALAEAADGWQDGAEDSDTGFGAADDGGGRRSERTGYDERAGGDASARRSRTSPKSASPETAARTAAAERFDRGAARGACRVVAALECRKTFNPFTATPVAGLHKKDRWLDQARALVEGESLAKAAERRQIHPSTAFRWRHRFLAALNHDKPEPLSGVVEADETFILELFEGSAEAGLARPARRRGGKAAKRGLSARRFPSSWRATAPGATLDAVLPRLDAASLEEAFGGTNSAFDRFRCDGGERPSPLSPSGPSSKSTSCLRPEIPSPKNRSSISTTSTPTTDASKSGCDASTASPPRSFDLSELATNPRSHARRSRPGVVDRRPAGLGPYEHELR